MGFGAASAGRRRRRTRHHRSHAKAVEAEKHACVHGRRGRERAKRGTKTDILCT